MKKILVFLAIAFIIPPIYAQIYISEYNATYFLEQDYVVKEEMLLNSRDAFNFERTLEFIRGDANDVRVSTSIKMPYKVHQELIYDYLAGTYKNITVIRVDLRDLWMLKNLRVVLSYRRVEGLSEENYTKIYPIKVLRYSDVGRYPWSIKECIENIADCKYKANIKFVTSEDYQFGNITPKGEKSRENAHEVLTYRLSILENLSAVQFGFPVKIEYARFKDLAISELASTEALINEASLSILDANSTLINAESYGAELEAASSLYSESLKVHQNAKNEYSNAELNFKYGDYYNAYLRAVSARKYARESSAKINEAKNAANFEIQKALMSNISKIEAKANQTKPLEGNISIEYLENLTIQKLAEIEKAVARQGIEPKGRNYYAPAFFLLLGSVAIFVGAGIIRAARKLDIRRRGTVKNFRVIGDLKRKTFKGFEKKVDLVKKGEEIAAKIVGLRKEREKFVLGIENLRKKKLAKEIGDETFSAERIRFEKRIAEIDSEIDELEAQLKEIRES